MKKYFVRLGSKQYGPATIEDLKKMNIGRDTLVWFKGLSKWTPADQIPEVKDALFSASTSSSSFGQTPGRPAQRSRRQTSIDDIVKSYEVQERPAKGKAIAWILLLAIAGGAFFAYDKYKNAPSTPTYTPPAVVSDSPDPAEPKIESKMEDRPQKKSEALYPINYLTIKPKLDNTEEYVIGTITNTASTAIYKDVSFTVFYENANGTTLDLEEFTVRNKIPPGETINFKLKANVPTGTKSTDVAFNDAKVDD